MGKLYIVSTPIGNLEDITLRALRVLREADVVLAEDTRSTQNLLRHYNAKPKKIISFFEGNEEKRIPQVLQLLKEGNVALVSESGTPLVSDPGFKLVREALRQNIAVEAFPGPTALIAALTVSGFAPNAFFFLGYLPKKETKIKKLFRGVKDSRKALGQVKTLIFYESPHRLRKTLYLIKEIFGNVDVCIARELTKLHQEVRREKVGDAIVHFEKTRPRGEFVILVSLEKV